MTRNYVPNISRVNSFLEQTELRYYVEFIQMYQFQLQYFSQNDFNIEIFAPTLNAAGQKLLLRLSKTSFECHLLKLFPWLQGTEW